MKGNIVADDSQKQIGRLKVFCAIAAEFDNGARSLSSVAQSLERRLTQKPKRVPVRRLTSRLSGVCNWVEANRRKGEKQFFVRSSNGRRICGLTSAGQNFRDYVLTRIDLEVSGWTWGEVMEWTAGRIPVSGDDVRIFNGQGVLVANEAGTLARRKEIGHAERVDEFHRGEGGPQSLPGSDQWKLQKAVDPVFARLPKDYPGRSQALNDISHEFRRAVAEQLQPTLNEHLAGMPQDTYAEKQAVATWVNAELRQLGLAIKCPKTGRPATLVADTRSAKDESSRFRLDVRGADGRHQRTFTSTTLPELELMEDEPRREGLARRPGRLS